ncbi:hypothetical protein FACS1894204_13650 [Synergistales bacterium]|nr:hypothetical protein FACS1894204_13650 [Synergistales bacterium]
MNEIALREELHALIETLPERSLYAIKPLLTFLCDEPIVETDLTDEERGLILSGLSEYDSNPASFVTLESLRF